MKGPMTTQTLRGLNTLDPFHWRGDRTNFTHFNGAFGSLLGGSPLSTADMNAYRDFINTIRFEPNPNQNLDRTLPSSFAGANPRAGFTNFVFDNYIGSPAVGLSCNACHALPEGSARFIVGAAALQESQDFKVPHLRNVYQKQSFNPTNGAVSVGGFGLTHDGVDPNLFTFLSRPVFGSFATDTTRKRNLAAFVLCFDTGTAPAVGHSRTIAAANANTVSLSNTWTLLENQARSNNVDVIVKGTVDGSMRGLLFVVSSNLYYADKAGVGPFTRQQLRDKALAGDVLTIMGVPPGSGRRMGIDRNMNGVLDGDEPPPLLRIARADTNAVVAWSTNASSFVLEAANTIPSTNWSVETSVRSIAGDEFNVTNAPASASRFFRLKGL
jgi:hypothetical protein